MLALLLSYILLLAAYNEDITLLGNVVSQQNYYCEQLNLLV